MTLTDRVKLLKDWWWLVVIAFTVIGFCAMLPARLNAVEKEVDDLKGWAKELQGYTRAMQQNAPQRKDEPIRLPAQPWRDYTKEGEEYCTDGYDAWWPDQQGQCE